MIIHALARFTLVIMYRANEDSELRAIVTFNKKRQEPDNRASGTYCMYGTLDGKTITLAGPAPGPPETEGGRVCMHLLQRSIPRGARATRPSQQASALHLLLNGKTSGIRERQTE
ncbi:hypothetical protein B0H13DRAFT_1888362 [Mycena leptocephala]|nr:hypothetical protein B0H13DRAFT_1888362 [Mycena leptocephala]